ncbi:hypothetical protein NL676_013068 [Syzygium grande]|nr:hypothetical protein NL676_013068 [Syzygium grande]
MAAISHHTTSAIFPKASPNQARAETWAATINPHQSPISRVGHRLKPLASHSPCWSPVKPQSVCPVSALFFGKKGLKSLGFARSSFTASTTSDGFPHFVQAAGASANRHHLSSRSNRRGLCSALFLFSVNLRDFI